MLTMEDRRIYPEGEIAVAGDTIVAVGERGCVPENFQADRVIDGSEMVALPGFVNCHTHAAMTLCAAMPTICL